MKVPVPADLDEEAANDYMFAYWLGWRNYRNLRSKVAVARELNPAAYDQGFGDSLRSTMNWKGRTR